MGQKCRATCILFRPWRGLEPSAIWLTFRHANQTPPITLLKWLVIKTVTSLGGVTPQTCITTRPCRVCPTFLTCQVVHIYGRFNLFMHAWSRCTVVLSNLSQADIIHGNFGGGVVHSPARIVFKVQVFVIGRIRPAVFGLFELQLVHLRWNAWYSYGASYHYEICAFVDKKRFLVTNR